jgi:hypothetical protein
MPDRDVAGGQDLRGYESVLVGDKGAMVFSRRSTKWKIIGRDPDEVKQIEESTPQSVARVEQEGISTQDANHVEWVDGIKGGGTPLSNFAHAGPFTETVLLGNLAVRTGQKVDWDGPAMKPSVKEAEKYVRRKYRKGWSL